MPNRRKQFYYTSQTSWPVIGLAKPEGSGGFATTPWASLPALALGEHVGQIGDSLGTNGIVGASDDSQIVQSLRNLPMKAWGFAPCFKYDYYTNSADTRPGRYWGSRDEFSVGGDDTGQMVTRIITNGEANNTPAKIMIIGPSPNDSAVGLTSAQIIANLTLLANWCFSKSIRVVMKTYPPRGVSNSLATCAGTAGGALAYNDAFWATMATVNTWIDGFANPLVRPCKKLDLNISSVYRAGTLSDGNANPGNVFEPKDNFYLDNLHPAAPTVWFWGKALSTIITSAFVSSSPWFDADPTVTNNFQRNGTFQGSMTGTETGSGVSGTNVSGTCWGGWGLIRGGDSLSGVTAVADGVADSGNGAFGANRLDCSINNPAGGMNTFQSYLLGAGTIPFTSGNGIGAVADDTWWQAFVRTNIDGWSGWRQFQPRIGTIGAPNIITYDELANYRDKEIIYPEAFDGYWLATPPHKKVSGNTTWFPRADYAVNALSQTGTGRHEHSRWILRQMASAPNA